MQRFPSRSADAAPTVGMDMTPLIPPGTSITSVEVDVEVWASSPVPDPSPRSTLSGPYELVNGVMLNGQLTDNVLLQRVSGGVIGCVYVLTFRANFANGDTDEEQVMQTVARYVPPNGLAVTP